VGKVGGLGFVKRGLVEGYRGWLNQWVQLRNAKDPKKKEWREAGQQSGSELLLRGEQRERGESE